MAIVTERFAEAVQTLIGDGPIKQRLAVAFATHLGDVADAELPVSLRRDFGDLQTALCKIAPVGNESRIRASVQKMSPDEAHQHAATIVRLYVDLLNGSERAEPLRIVEPPRKPPRYLTSRP
jgi:hypothetical protein